MANLTAAALKSVAIALGNSVTAAELSGAVNNGNYLANLATHAIVGAIVATATSTTTDFGSLAVDDIVLCLPAAAGTSIFYEVATAGTLPAAATVGSLYVVLRAPSLPAAAETDVTF